MVAIARVRTDWQGFVGAPGYTVMHFRDFGGADVNGSDITPTSALGAVTRVYDFFNAIKGLMPSAVKLQVSGEVDILDSTNGELVDSLSVTQPAVLTGTGTGTYSAPNGAVVNWKTNGIRNGRRIRGRTFIVPMNGNSYGTDGQIIAGSRTTLQTAANALAASTGTPDLTIFARPSSAGATDGQVSVVTSAAVPTMVAVLRSRRD